MSVSSSEEAAGPAAPAGPAIVQGEEARARAAIQARANVVIGYALELAEAVDELQAYRSLLTALNSSPIELAQPHVRALAVVRAGAWRSAIWLVCALLEPLGRERSNLGQVFHMLKDQAVADDLTAPDSKRHKLPDRRKLDEAITRHAQLVGSKRYANVRHLRNSMAHLLSGKLETVEYSDVFLLADEIDACVTELHQDIGLDRVCYRDRLHEDATLFRETYIRGAE